MSLLRPISETCEDVSLLASMQLEIYVTRNLSLGIGYTNYPISVLSVSKLDYLLVRCIFLSNYKS